MPTQTRIVAPGPQDRSVRTASGDILQPPDDWVLLSEFVVRLPMVAAAAEPPTATAPGKASAAPRFRGWGEACALVK